MDKELELGRQNNAPKEVHVLMPRTYDVTLHGKETLERWLNDGFWDEETFLNYQRGQCNHGGPCEREEEGRGIWVQEPRNEGGSGIWDRKDVGSLLESPEERQLGQLLILAVGHLGLLTSRTVLFQATKFEVICYSRNMQ